MCIAVSVIIPKHKCMHQLLLVRLSRLNQYCNSVLLKGHHGDTPCVSAELKMKPTRLRNYNKTDILYTVVCCIVNAV